MSDLDQTFLSIDVKESVRGRDYWATRKWVDSETQEKIRSADIVIVPWENFRDRPALFPQETDEIFQLLNEEMDTSTVAMGAPKNAYEEIALHSQDFKLPTIFVTALLLPTLAQILGNRIDRALPGYTSDSTIEMEVIVEGKRGNCISIKYKGPKDDLAPTLLKQTERCLPKVKK